MRLIRMMGVAAMLAFQIVVVGRATPVPAATLKAEACFNASGECKELLWPDTFTAHSGKVELEGLGIKFNNVCLSIIKGRLVTEAGLAKSPLPLEMDIESATFTRGSEFEPCTFQVLTSNLPWRILTYAGTIPPTNFPSGLIDKVLMTLHAIGECHFTQSAQDEIKLTWLDGAPSGIDLGGSMNLANGNPFCPSLAHIRGSYKITAAVAKDLITANNIRILKE